AFEDSAAIDAYETGLVGPVASVAHQAAGRREVAKLKDRRHRVPERQCSELFAPAHEESVAGDHEPAYLPLDESCEDRGEIAFDPRMHNMGLPPKNAGRRLQGPRLGFGSGIDGIDEHRD